jgi:hypothetical protein
MYFSKSKSFDRKTPGYRSINGNFGILIVSISSLMFGAQAHASTFVVNRQQVRKYSHSQIHFGLFVMGRSISENETNYLHGKYHSLSSACLSNPRARTQLRASPQLISLMGEYDFLR